MILGKAKNRLMFNGNLLLSLSFEVLLIGEWLETNIYFISLKF